MEDAEWIREELHRWIYGNVRAKWNSVLACTRGESYDGSAQYDAFVRHYLCIQYILQHVQHVQ